MDERAVALPRRARGARLAGPAGRPVPRGARRPGLLGLEARRGGRQLGEEEATVAREAAAARVGRDRHVLRTGAGHGLELRNAGPLREGADRVEDGRGLLL